MDDSSATSASAEEAKALAVARGVSPGQGKDKEVRQFEGLKGGRGAKKRVRTEWDARGDSAATKPWKRGAWRRVFITAFASPQRVAASTMILQTPELREGLSGYMFSDPFIRVHLSPQDGRSGYSGRRVIGSNLLFGAI